MKDIACQLFLIFKHHKLPVLNEIGGLGKNPEPKLPNGSWEVFTFLMEYTATAMSINADNNFVNI